ncbi:MAG: hypothetical protein ABJ205_13335 [Erythrobacter sp.]|uniref:hypothetical protein n=1 Tax=Erythrobacter sp. TaxID=1042 RepID=UPI0032664A64
MKTLEKSYTASFNEENGELHSSIAGLWSEDSIQEYFDAVNDSAVPLLKARKSIHAFVDFSGFVPQDRGTSEKIRDHLLASAKFGLKRIAIIGATPLMQMQYKRLSHGIEVSFKDNKLEALAWLRS